MVMSVFAPYGFAPLATQYGANLHRGICPLFQHRVPGYLAHKFVRESAKMVNGAASLAARQHDDQDPDHFRGSLSSPTNPGSDAYVEACADRHPAGIAYPRCD